MCKDSPDEDATGPVVDSRDEPILVSFDVEHCVAFDGIGARKRLANFRQAIPLRFLGDTEPGIEWAFQISRYRRRFAQPLSGDHMHPSGPRNRFFPLFGTIPNSRPILGELLPVQHLATPIRFSFCELVKQEFRRMRISLKPWSLSSQKKRRTRSRAGNNRGIILLLIGGSRPLERCNAVR